MKLKLLGVTCILMLLLTGSAFSAVTGKIVGVITDAANQQPLVGVTVAVQGTNWGAITDTEGRYTILNVPVGAYVVVISAVGYNPIEVSNVEVHSDLATYQSQAMTTSVTELTTTITVRAETPLIVKDKTTTVNIVKAEEIQSMPTRGFEQIVGLQNSVVRMNSNVDTRQRGGRESMANGPELNLRGGRPSEVAYYVDGFSQQDPLSGISTANISNNAIKEVSITSGTFSAEYGHVASGIVNVVTNSGSDEYHATAEVVTDNWGQSEGTAYDHNYYTADVSGPVPGLEKGYFYFSGERRYLQDRTPSPITEEVFSQYDLPMDGNMLPNNSLSGWSYQGKIDYNLTPEFKITLNGNGSIDNWQEYRHYYNNPAQPGQIEHSPRYKDENLGLNAKITHTLNANNYYNLSVSYFSTKRFRGDGVVFDDYAAYDREFANPEYDIHNLFREGELQDNDEFYESYWANYLDRRSSYIGIKGDYNSQVNSNNTLKLGFDFQRHALRYFENLDATSGFLETRVNRYGFDSTGETSDNEDFRNDAKNPINLGLYIQDRFEWRGLIVNAGLRFDYFDYKALRLRNLERPMDPDGYLLDTFDIVVQDSLALVLDRADLEESEKFTRLSPRLGVSFPISDRSQMHINFGKFFQRPDLRRLYTGYDFLEARIDAGSYYPFASPNLEPEKITQYEVGLTHQLGEFTAFDITAYYKDVQDLTQIFHQSPGFPTAYDFYGNVDYGTIKGVDFAFNMRRSRNLSMMLKYSLSYATGTGSYANTSYNIAWKNAQGTPKSTNPLDYDQRHTLIGNFDLRFQKGDGPEIGGFKPLENLIVNTIVQLGSGTPYTPTLIYDGVSVNAAVNQQPTGSINSVNMPWSFNIDMKIERGFAFRGAKITPYFWVKNLLDKKNVTGVYEGTGEPTVSGYLESPEGVVRASDAETGAEFADRYDFGQQNPKNYASPRMMFFGLRVSF